MQHHELSSSGLCGDLEAARAKGIGVPVLTFDTGMKRETDSAGAGQQ